MKFIVTFGGGHLGGFGLHYHLEVDAPSEIKARIVVNEAFDRKWSMIYDGDTDYVLKYGTKCLGKIEVSEGGSWKTVRS